MSKRSRFVILAALIIAFAVFQGQRTGNELQALKASGFSLDRRINSVPPLVLDLRHRQLALLYPDRSERYPFDQVESWRVVDQTAINDRPDYYLAIQLQGSALPVKLQGQHEVDLKQWAALLDEVIGRR